MENDVLMLEGYYLIDPAHIHELTTLRYHPEVQNVAKFRLDDLLPGKPRFRVNGTILPHTEKLGENWARWVHALAWQEWTWGLTAWKLRSYTEADERVLHTTNQEDYKRRDAIEKEAASEDNERVKDREWYSDDHAADSDGWVDGHGPSHSALTRLDQMRAPLEQLYVDPIDLDQVDVYYRPDPLCRSRLRFFYRESANRLPYGSFFHEHDSRMSREILHVFWRIVEEPSMSDNGGGGGGSNHNPANGTAHMPGGLFGLGRSMAGSNVQLNSRLNRLRDDMRIVRQNRQCHLQGSIAMSNPSVLLQERPEPKPDDSDSHAAGLAHAPVQNVDAVIRQSDVNSRVKARNLHLEFADQLRNKISYERDVHAIMTNQHMQTLEQQVTSETRVYHLTPGRELVQQAMAQAVPYLMDMEIRFRETVWSHFDVPLAVQLNVNPAADSASRQTVGKSSASGTPASSDKSSDSTRVYKLMLSRQRSDLIDAAQETLDEATRPHRIVMAWSRSPKRTRHDTRIRLELPGMAEMNAVNEWWMKGMIKDEYVQELSSSWHHIDKEAWLTKPKLTHKEIVGIEEPDDNPSNAGKVLSEWSQKKKGTKSKAKGKSKAKKE